MVDVEDRALAQLVSAHNFIPAVLARAASIDWWAIKTALELNAGTETAAVIAGLIASLLAARAQVRTLTEDR